MNTGSVFYEKNKPKSKPMRSFQSNSVISVKLLHRKREADLIEEEESSSSSLSSWDHHHSNGKNPKNFQPTRTSLVECIDSELSQYDDRSRHKNGCSSGGSMNALKKPSFTRFYAELTSIKKFDPNLKSTPISFDYFSNY